MIANRIIQFVIDSVKEMGDNPDYTKIKTDILEQWHELYHEEMLVKLYWKYENDPEFEKADVTDQVG